MTTTNGSKIQTAAMSALLIAAVASCADAVLDPQAKAIDSVDDRLTLTGTVCTEAPATSDFPVKILFLVDKSGSMCITDPPGSQAQNGFCSAHRPPGVTEPGRVRAIKTLVNKYRGIPQVQLAIVPWESKVQGAIPPGGNGPEFIPADQITDADIEALQNDLGKGTDYQGAMAEGARRVESDILNTPRQQRPRTKYVVILLTDGVPYPRCAADDALPVADYATAANPSGIWADTPTAQSFCNSTDPQNEIPGFKGGTDRNQNYQIFGNVDDLMRLGPRYGVGELRLHAMLLFSVDAAIACGQICVDDIFNGFSVADAHTIAEWTLRQMAEVRGGGTYTEFTTTQSIDFGNLNYASLAEPYSKKQFFAMNLAAVQRPKTAVVDSDGDGLSDEDEFALGTSRFLLDTDGDGFSDLFEVQHASEGFDPLVPDIRGCKAIAGQPPPSCSCRDLDGDGLSECAERLLGTDPTLADSDADGLPDGWEVRHRLDPLVADDPLRDSDFDGVPNVVEATLNSDPMSPDPTYRDQEGYRVEVKDRQIEDGRTCYDFTVSNIRLLSPLGKTGGQMGTQKILLNFAQAPAGDTHGDFGRWRVACARAQFVPPRLRVPAGSTIELRDGYCLKSKCVGPGAGAACAADTDCASDWVDFADMTPTKMVSACIGAPEQ